jgi:uncharacterized protein (TIGR03067 family)
MRISYCAVQEPKSGIPRQLFFRAQMAEMPKVGWPVKIKTVMIAMLMLVIAPFGELPTSDIAASKALAVDPSSEPAATTKSDAKLLQGVWVFDGFTRDATEMLSAVWTAKLTVTGDAFTVDGFLGIAEPVKGTIHLDSTTDPKQFDMDLAEVDLAKYGAPYKIPAGKYPGIYKWQGDRLSVCFVAEVGGSRPRSFEASGDRVIRATLVKAPEGFKSFPKEIAVKVLGPNGAQVKDAIIGCNMVRRGPVLIRGPDNKTIETSKLTEEQRKRLDRINGPIAGSIYDETSGWSFLDAKKLGADGTLKMPYGDLRFHSNVTYDPKNSQMGFARMSPSSLLDGTVTVTLQPVCRVVVSASCADLAKTEYAGMETFNAYIETMDGRGIVSDTNQKSGQLEYLLPPGDYVLELRGVAGLMGSKRTKFAVPKNQSVYTVPPVAVPATEYLKLLGNSVPELSDVVAWKGEPVKLADQKGKIVLVEFWGYWCGGCIQNMPVLMELHEKFKDRGLIIVGIHVDGDGEVDTVKALDEKLSLFRKEHWKGKDIPFPVALVSGKREGDSEDAGRGTVANRYGIRGYPSTLIIDRDGKLIGKLPTSDLKMASERIEYLLKDKKE